MGRKYVTTLTKNTIDVNGLCTTFQRRNVSVMFLLSVYVEYYVCAVSRLLRK